MKKIQKINGITLGALIITIIIMLILAGVTISVLLGNNGLVEKVNISVAESKKAQVKEKIQLEIFKLYIDKNGEDLTFAEIANRLVEKGITTISSINSIENTIVTIENGFVVKIMQENSNWKVDIISTTTVPTDAFYFEALSDVTIIRQFPAVVTLTVKNNNGDDYTAANILYNLNISNSDNLTFAVEETTGTLLGGSKQEKVFNVTISKKDTALEEFEENIKFTFNSESPVTASREVDLQAMFKSDYYYIVEVYDHLGNEGAVINEIELYNSSDEKITYNVLTDKVYDTATNSSTYYWTHGTYWNYTNLYDQNVEYTSNTQGGANTTLFLYSSSANTSNWARFIIHTTNYIEKVKMNIGGPESRMPKEISLYEVSSYTEDTYTTNIRQRNNEGLILFNKLLFSTPVLNGEWYWFTESEIGKIPYYIIDVYDHFGSNGAAINELELYDKNEEKTNYTVVYAKCYDSNNNGYPTYWTNGNYWNYTNLYDGSVEYTTNNQGGQNAALFIHSSTANTGKWARFLISPNDNITKFKFSLGNPTDERMPKEISVYEVSEYTENIYNNNIKQRNNTGITYFGKLQVDSARSTPTWFDINK